MTPDERQMLSGLFERVNGAGSQQRDPQAESFINDAVRAAPFAPYVLSQTVLVQQQALEAAAHRIAELEAAAHEAAQQQQGQGGFLGGLSSLFGGGPSNAPQRPDPSAYRGPVPAQPPRGYAPPAPPPPPDPYQGQQPPRGPWGAPPAGGGGGFLQNAMSTATGVAGGVVLGNLIGGLFGGGHGGGLFGGGSAMAQPTETINNYYENAPDPGQGIDPGVPDDAGYIDDSSFGDSGGGYDDA